MCFFFQAEDGIRVLYVTGVQTCALPISLERDDLAGACRITPLCLDETLRDATSARQIVALEGPMVWNIKVHRDRKSVVEGKRGDISKRWQIEKKTIETWLVSS